MRIELATQVRDFIKGCPPEPRRWFRSALTRLEQEQGDIKPLRDELEGYYRLRIRSYRIIFRYLQRGSQRMILCDFAEHRGVVYETFLNLLH